jgi:diguanylate cyclase (GGDEF)-like protein/PAS domain S-box-containing protein
MPAAVLLVADDRARLRAAAALLRRAFPAAPPEVTCVTTVHEARETLRANAFDYVLVEALDAGALATIDTLLDTRPDVPLVALAATESLRDEAVRRGAHCLPRRTTAAALARAVETALDDAATRFRGALAAAVGNAVVAVAPDGRVRFWNVGAEALYGWTAAETLGRDIGDVPAFAALHDRLDEARAALLRDGCWTVDLDGPRRDGTPLRTRFTATPMRDDAGRLLAVVGVATDVTTSRVTEDAARRMAAAIESSDDAIIVRDVDGIVTTWNAAAERLVGYPAAEAIGRHATFATPPEKHEQIHDVIARVARGETIPAYEQVVLRKDGSRGHISLSVSAIRDGGGRVIGSSAIARDITEQVALRRAAEADRRRLAEAQEIAGLGSFEILDGGATVWSDQMYRLVGFAPGTPVDDEALAEHVHPEDREAFATAHQAARTATEPVEVAYRVVRPDGDVRSLMVRLCARPADDGTTTIAGTALDVTERTRAEQHRRAAERRFELGFETAAAGTAIVDLDGRLVRVNAALCRLLGRDHADLLGHRPVEFVHPEDLGAPTPFAEAIGGKGRGGAELRFVRADGTVVEALVDVVVVRGESDDPEYLFAQLLDITWRKEAERALEHQALHDALTGLPNRTLLLDRLEHALAQRNGAVAALLIDMDQFKLVNDGMGHSAGDALLVETARRLVGAVRPGDTVCRLGGDEFVICCEQVASPEAAMRIAERVAAAFTAPFVVEGRDLFVTVSVGVTISEDGATSDSLLRDADAAMYRAKERGRARVEMFDEALRERAATRLATASSLRRALRDREFVVHYQPVLTLGEERLVGFEALVRWDDPERGLVPPAEFVPIAEETGLIVPLGAEVLRQATAQLAEWSATFAGAAELTMAVNVSARQLADPSFVPSVAEILAASGVDPSRVRLEITESVLMEDVEDSVRVLGRLAELGVSIEIDDFGTGYSSLGYLKRLPVHTLKVDREFVRGLGEDAEDTSIVTAIVALGHALGLRLHAEGIETDRQRDAARALGCDVAQGFRWSAAVPAAEAERWLRRRVLSIVPDQRFAARAAAV